MSRIFGIATTMIVVAALCASDVRAQAPAQQTTIWSFLGIPQGIRTVRGALTNRRGNHPRMEPHPARKALNDPANLAEGMPPVIQEAAKVKMAEDLKPQKIKAIKYLARIGCGCYDLDGNITKALVEAASDCTEEVRLATVEAIAEAAAAQCCAQCGQTCCCKQPILEQLAKMAYQRDDHGCYVEPSQRVRQAAARALMICCPSTGPVPLETIEAPTPVEEVPNGELIPPVDEDEEEEGSSAEEFGTETATLPPVVNSRLLLAIPSQPSTGVISKSDLQRFQVEQPSVPPLPGLEVVQSAAPVVGISEVRGVIVTTQPERQIAHVHFVDRERQVPVGTRLTVLRSGESGRLTIGQVEVEQSFEGASNVRAIGTTMIHQLQSGDVVELPGSHLASR